jgi:DNA mismatch endonuclease (patch repair protein)
MNPGTILRKRKLGKDLLTKEQRSWNMSRIRGRDTAPEKVVRSLLHRLGYRFRLDVRIRVPPATLSSPVIKFFVRPDIVLKKHKTVIFVHGCFWHRHRGCKNCTTPTNHREWWLKKLNGNAARDKIHSYALRRLGWRTSVVWECQTENQQNIERLNQKLKKMLG